MVRTGVRSQHGHMTQIPPSGEQGAEPPTGTQTSEPPPGPRVTGDQMRDLNRLRRSVTDRKIAGVAGGLGRHLDVDPTILRVALVVLCFFGGAGFVVYAAAWLLVSEDGQPEAAIKASPSTRNTALVIAGVLAAILLVGDGWWGGWGFPWPLALIGLVVFLVLGNRGKVVSSEPTTVPPWAPPAAPATQVYPPAAPKRDRGPKLFWITLALVAVALGTLGLYEVSGGPVVDAAYPALALTVVGAMLVVGAWVGRAGGLILLGLLAAVALVAANVSDTVDRVDRVVAPQSASQVQDRYSVPFGSVELDLSQVDDLDALDGREIAVDAFAGEVVVIVPPDVDVAVDAAIDGGGEARVFGETESGNNVRLEGFRNGGDEVPDMSLDIDLVFGQLEVRQP